MNPYFLYAGIADLLNREYQAGGDARTLARIGNALMLDMNASDRARFRNIAEMGGLSLTDNTLPRVGSGRSIPRT